MSKFFRNFFLAYMLILLVTLVTFLFLYTRSSVIIEDQIIASRIASLGQMSMNLDHNLSEIIKSVNQVANDSQVRRFINIWEPLHGPNVMQVSDTMDVLRDMHIDSPLVLNTFIVYDNNVVMSRYAAWTTSVFYPHIMNIYGIDYPKWRADIFSGNPHSRFVPAIDINLGPNRVSAIQYIMPIHTRQGAMGAIIALIDSRAIQDMFHMFSMVNGEWGFVLSQGGEIISGDTRDMYGIPTPEGREGSVRFVQNGVNYLMVFSRSNILDWTYVSIIESDYVLTELNSFRRMVVLAVLVMLAITLPLSIVFSIRQFMPVKKLQETLVRQMPILQHSFIKDIFDGKLIMSDNVKENMASLGLNLTGDLYTVIAISGKESPIDLIELAKVHMFVDNYPVSHLNDGIKQQSLNLGNNVLAVLFIGNSATLKEYVQQFAKLLADVLRENELSGIGIGIGGVYAQLTEVYKSYAEAIEAIQYFMVINSGQVVCMFEDMPHNNEFYYYPEEEEHRLLNMVRSGESEGARDLLNAICSENFINKQLSHVMMTAFINHLCQGIFKIGRPSLVSDETVRKTNDLYEVFYQLTDIEKLMRCTRLYNTISEDVRNQKLNKTHNTIAEIRALCEEDFHNPDISLTGLATRFNLSETYLSMLFKEYTGENFYNYLQNMRMDKAMKLLATSSLSIHEISKQVGYSSYNTFSKAFKRKTGINAGDYRMSEN